jgi:hypothetical protein
MLAERQQAHGALQAANLSSGLRAELVPNLEVLVHRLQPEGLLVMGLNEMRLLDAYDAVLDALADCHLPVQPLVARQALLVKHGDAPFWRSVKAEAIPLLEGCRFP